MIPREFFRDDELRCHCGCRILPPQTSVERLYALRISIGRPLPISSAARCVAHNRASGGKSGSIHLSENKRRGKSRFWGGAAFDIVANLDFQADIYAAALLLGFRGFGFGNGFIHIDDSKRPQIDTWRY